MNFFKSILKKIKKTFFIKQTLAILALCISFYYFSKSSKNWQRTVTFDLFLMTLSKNIISDIYLSKNSVKFKGNNSAWYQTDRSLITEKRLDKIMMNYPNVKYSKYENILSTLNRSTLLIYGISFIVIIQTVRFLRDFHYPVSVKKDKLVSSSIKFQDVCGHHHAKKELNQIIEFLNNPEKYLNIGARIRKGVLLYGPPGSGKTLLAKALAGETNIPFINCVGSEFNEIYTGAGQRKIRELFMLARKNTPCIIFIDELDGLGCRSSQRSLMMQNQEINNTINQLLNEIDGFQENSLVIMLAATNRIHLVDDALIRSGRFDIKIQLELPNENERSELLQSFLKKKKHQILENKLYEFSKILDGFSGADIENLVNESGYNAIDSKRTQIEIQDLEIAFKKILQQKTQ